MTSAINLLSVSRVLVVAQSLKFCPTSGYANRFSFKSCTRLLILSAGLLLVDRYWVLMTGVGREKNLIS